MIVERSRERQRKRKMERKGRGEMRQDREEHEIIAENDVGAWRACVGGETGARFQDIRG